MEHQVINQLFRRITEQDDQEAFNSFYKLLFLPVLRFSYSYTRSKEIAEEIANDVFLHCWQKRKELTNIKNPQVFLFVCAKNRAIDHARKHPSSRQIVSMTELDEQHVRFNNDPEKLFITAEMMRKVEDAVQQLPPKCRTIFILVKQYGLKYKEVATLQQLSVKTVENQLAIAMQKLTQAVNFTLEQEMARNT